jgi:hypothetical protein
MRRGLAVLSLSLACGCLPSSFDALADAAPVHTEPLVFPVDQSAELAVALTVAADDESRGRVLFGDGERALGWLRLDLDGRVELRFAQFGALTELGSHPDHAEITQPRLTGLAIVPDAGIAEGLVRIAAEQGVPDRVVRFRVADFSRIDDADLDMRVYPWVADPAPVLHGAVVSVQLDDGLPELLSVSEDGVFVWDSLGTSLPIYEQARASMLAANPDAFADDPSQGYGLTHCPGLQPSALAGGRVLPDDGRAALALSGDTLTFIAVADPGVVSLVGAPIYDCERASLSLPGPASVLAVVDLGLDGDDDLLVGAPEQARVWVYENLGDGLPSAPTFTLESPGDELEFGASVTSVELGGDAPEVIVVGAPGTAVDGKVRVGRVLVFDASDGTLLRSIEDLEPRTDSRHGLAVHGLDFPGREELVVSGARELRVHWSILAGDEGPAAGAE